MTAESATKFEIEICRIIDYFRDEFDLTYNEAIGILQTVSWRLNQGAYEEQDEEEDHETT